MRVGILTFHFGRNYGALLQAYGIRKAIESLGHDAVVLHYIPQHFSEHMAPAETPWLRLGWRTYGVQMAIERRLRTFRFNRFKKKELLLTSRCDGKGDLARQVAGFDALVVGSDQVWNLNYVESEDLCYFLDFPRPKDLRCISYAACCGQKDQPSACLAKIPSLLAAFHSLSVRNDVTAEFVKTMIGQTPAVVADPTLLVDYDALEDGYNPDAKYILAYALEGKSFADYQRAIVELKQKLGLPVWAIASGNAQWEDIPFPGADRNWFGVSPGRFLSLVKQAACVVTDSFHGTIFSIKYQRPFVTLNDGGWRNARMFDLANRYGIGHRIQNIHHPIDPSFLMRTDDLISIQDRFNKHKAASYEFLRQALTGNIQA